MRNGSNRKTELKRVEVINELTFFYPYANDFTVTATPHAPRHRGVNPFFVDETAVTRTHDMDGHAVSKQ